VHYASADVFFFPSLTETFGNVVPEAMASGLAVVGHHYAAASQVVRTGRTACSCRWRRCGLRGRWARNLAGQPAQIRAMGAAARETARQLDWLRVVKAVESEYLSAMAETVSRSRARSGPALCRRPESLEPAFTRCGPSGASRRSHHHSTDTLSGDEQAQARHQAANVPLRRQQAA
jgi:hypothetical protein